GASFSRTFCAHPGPGRGLRLAQTGVYWRLENRSLSAYASLYPSDSSFDSALVFIRPQEWTDVLARAYRISPRQAGQLLRAAADETATTGETRDLLRIWDRACKACDRYTARREFAVGIMLGYFRWRT